MPWIELDETDPGQLDMAIRAAIHLCWAQMPPGRQAPDAVEAAFRRRVERALSDFREDAQLFRPLGREPNVAEVNSTRLLDGLLASSGDARSEPI